MVKNYDQRLYEIFEELIIYLYDITIDDIDDLKQSKLPFAPTITSNKNNKISSSNRKKSSYISHIKQCLDNSKAELGVSYQDLFSYVSQKKGNSFKRGSLTTSLRRAVKTGKLVLIKEDNKTYYRYKL